MDSNPVRHDQLGYFMRTEVDYKRTKKQKSYYIIKMEISSFSIPLPLPTNRHKLHL